MRRLFLALLPAAMLVTAGMDASAQTDSGTLPNAGAFEALSPGNQKIAQALFDAQQTPMPGTPTSPTAPPTTAKVYTRDEIAALKQSGTGWGVIFKQMQAQGQLQGAKNLGQVVSGKYQPPTPAPGATTPAPASTATGGSGTPGASPGAFDRLSPGNQKIVQALFDAQQTPMPGTPTSPTAPKVYTRDEIAALKQSGTGWGGVFREMKTQGQLQGAKNLGQVVSGKYASSTGTTTITTASGRTEVVGTRPAGGSGQTAWQKHGGTESAAHSSGKGSGHGGGVSTVGRGSGGHGNAAHAKPDHAGAKTNGHGRIK